VSCSISTFRPDVEEDRSSRHRRWSSLTGPAPGALRSSFVVWCMAGNEQRAARRAASDGRQPVRIGGVGLRRPADADHYQTPGWPGITSSDSPVPHERRSIRPYQRRLALRGRRCCWACAACSRPAWRFDPPATCRPQLRCGPLPASPPMAPRRTHSGPARRALHAPSPAAG
jgi:hypothetical protein